MGIINADAIYVKGTNGNIALACSFGVGGCIYIKGLSTILEIDSLDVKRIAFTPIPQSGIYLNFDNNSSYPAEPVDITFNHFLGGTVCTDTATIHSLADEDNVVVNETMQIAVALTGTWYEGDTTGDNSGFLPDTTMHGFMYANGVAYGEIEFANLNPNYTYTIKVWGVEGLGTQEEEYTKYTVGVERYEIQTNSDVTGWDKEVGATFENLAPDVNGELMIITEKGTVGTHGALVSGVKIERTQISD